MSRRARTTTRRTPREERRPAGELPTHRPPRDWQTVAPLASDIRGRMGRPTGE
ncbi:MAG: hypothetical protein V5A31_08820 [Haloferacaceae archaeon]